MRHGGGRPARLRVRKCDAFGPPCEESCSVTRFPNRECGESGPETAPGGPLGGRERRVLVNAPGSARRAYPWGSTGCGAPWRGRGPGGGAGRRGVCAGGEWRRGCYGFQGNQGCSLFHNSRIVSDLRSSSPVCANAPRIKSLGRRRLARPGCLARHRGPGRPRLRGPGAGAGETEGKEWVAKPSGCG